MSTKAASRFAAPFLSFLLLHACDRSLFSRRTHETQIWECALDILDYLKDVCDDHHQPHANAHSATTALDRYVDKVRYFRNKDQSALHQKQQAETKQDEHKSASSSSTAMSQQQLLRQLLEGRVVAELGAGHGLGGVYCLQKGAQLVAFQVVAHRLRCNCVFAVCFCLPRAACINRSK